MDVTFASVVTGGTPKKIDALVCAGQMDSGLSNIEKPICIASLIFNNSTGIGFLAHWLQERDSKATSTGLHDTPCWCWASVVTA